jgi:hypothetical protein
VNVNGHEGTMNLITSILVNSNAHNISTVPMSTNKLMENVANHTSTRKRKVPITKQDDFKGNKIITLDNIVNDTNSVNTDTSQLANTDTSQSVITDFNNQDLLNITSISSTNNVYSMLPVSQNSLKVYHQNICGLNYKTNEMLSFLYPDYLHIICLTEHHLNQFQLHNVSIDNYNLGTSYHGKSALKGGVCIYVLKNLNFTTVNLKACCSDNDIEICAVKLHSIFSHICVFSIYRSPTGNFTHFLYKVDIILKSLLNSKIKVIICGDVNINYLTDTHR